MYYQVKLDRDIPMLFSAFIKDGSVIVDRKQMKNIGVA